MFNNNKDLQMQIDHLTDLLSNKNSEVDSLTLELMELRTTNKTLKAAFIQLENSVTECMLRTDMLAAINGKEFFWTEFIPEVIIPEVVTTVPEIVIPAVQPELILKSPRKKK